MNYGLGSELLGFDRTQGRALADFFCGTHGFKRARHDLRGARTTRVVSRFGFEQLGMGEDDAELIVQAMEEETQFRRFVHRAPHQQLLYAVRPRRFHAWLRPTACHIVCTAGRSLLFGSRHRVSTKMRTEPPAVRTYSIFPLESQL